MKVIQHFLLPKAKCLINMMEVGAAGNSPEEAVYAARLFARGLAKTILPEEDAP